MSLFHNLIAEPLFNDVVMVIGDSIAFGASSAAGPTPVARTAYQWPDSATAAKQIGATDLDDVIAGGSPGSQWPSFCIEYYNRTKRKACIVDCALGGSVYYYVPDPDLSWYTNGPLWDAAVAKTGDCLAKYGKTRPDLVYINLGINDSRNNTGATYSHMTSLIDRIIAEYGSGVRIMMNFVGVGPTYSFANLAESLRYTQLKRWQWQLSVDYDEVEVSQSLSVYQIWSILSSNYYKVDDIHLNTGGNAVLGERGGYQFSLSTTLHKNTRFILANMFSEMDATRRNAVETFIRGLETDGLLELMNSFIMMSDGGTNDLNIVTDWFGLGFCRVVGGTVGQDGVLFDGVDDYASVGPPSEMLRVGSLGTDWLEGKYVVDNMTSGVSAMLSGLRFTSAGPFLLMQQNSSNNKAIHNSTDAPTPGSITNAGAYLDNTLYTQGRNGGNGLLYIDDTLTLNTAQAFTDPGSNAISEFLGAYNERTAGGSAVAAQFWHGKMGYRFLAKRDGMNMTNLKSRLDALWTAFST